MRRAACLLNTLFNSKSYKLSRGAYAIQATLEYLITLMVTDAFLANILRSLGLSDASIGIVATFVSLAMFIQIGSLSISKASVNSKKIVTVCSTVSQVLFAFVYVIPFLPVSASVKKVIAVLCILVAYASMYIVWPILYKWAYKFVSPEKRASFSATKEMLSLGLGVLFTLGMGWVVDRYEGLGNADGAFIFIAISMTIISICNIACLVVMKEEPQEAERCEKKKFSEIMKNTFGNKSFNSCVIAVSMWEFARFFQLGFMGTFKQDILVSTFLIQIVNMTGLGVRIVLSKPVARFSDKRGYDAGFSLGLIIAASAFFVNMFSSKEMWFFVVLYTILHNLCYVGVNSNSYNILYSYVDERYISEALAVKNCIAGITGFVSALIAGKILDYIQSSGNTFMGISVCGQQVLSAISFVLTIAVLVYVKTVVSKLEKNK